MGERDGNLVLVVFFVFVFYILSLKRLYDTQVDIMQVGRYMVQFMPILTIMLSISQGEIFYLIHLYGKVGVL